jgi:hypothetical protein
MRLKPTAGTARRLVGLISLMMSCLYSTANAQTAPPPPRACSEVMAAIASPAERVAPGEFAYLRNSGAILCFWELALPQLSLSSSLRAQAAVQKSAATVQTGAPNSSSGSTSAVSKPSTPLSLATEYGGITSSTSNQTMTLQTTLDGIPAALANHGFASYCWSPIVTIPGCVSASHLGWLNRVGLGITANTTNSSQSITGAASPSTSTAQQASLKTAGTTAPSFASVFTKVTILRGKFEPGKTILSSNGKAVNDAQEKIILATREIQKSGVDVDSWSNCVVTQFTPDHLSDAAAQNGQFNKYWVQIVDVFFASTPVHCDANAQQTPQDHIAALRPTSAQRDQWTTYLASNTLPADTSTDSYKKYMLIKGRLDLINAVDDYLAAVSIFEAQSDQLLKAAAPALSLEYDYNTPVNKPTTSTAKLVFSYAWWKETCKSAKGGGKDTNAANTINRLTSTINAGGNFYNSPPSSVPGASAFRDAQAGTELDYAICNSKTNPILSWLGNATFGLTYYYQDQKSPSILKVTPGMPLPGITITGLASTTSTVFATKGPINFVQLKYGLGTGKNVKFPIAVSWSNRTDLITHSLWSAQFGVSYDFSSLLNSSSTTDTSSGK